MTTVKDLGVTENKIRAYVLNDNGEMSEDMLKGICYDYLNKVIRKNEKKWPKELRLDLAKIGVTLDIDTGLPVIDEEAKELKKDLRDLIFSARDIVFGMESIISKNDIITVVGKSERDGSSAHLLRVEEELHAKEIVMFEDRVVFESASRVACEQYISKLRDFCLENNLNPPEMV